MSRESKNASEAASKALRQLLSRKVVRIGSTLKNAKSDRKRMERGFR